MRLRSLSLVRSPFRALRLGPLAAALLTVACGGDGASDFVSGGHPRIVRPSSPVTDLARSEDAALAVERALAVELAGALGAGDLSRARGALIAKGFLGVAPVLGSRATAGELDVTWLKAAAEPSPDSDSFLGALASLAPLAASERVEAEILRFELDPSGSRSTALARLRWAGPQGAAPSVSPRLDVTVYAEVEMQREEGQWRLAQFLPATDHRHTHGAGHVLASDSPPLYVDRTDSVGLSLGTSQANRRLIQSFVNRHRTLALGGLTVTDFNGDERPDLIATRAEETSLVFLNDGAAGFIPAALPIKRRSDFPAFVLSIDLDGDGLDELVGTEISQFEGETAYAGLWTRTPAAGESGSATAWRHLPRACPLPNEVGMRRLAVQNVVPLDADGDGDLDLFFAVYGNAASRGEHYNTVEAHDGADNYLAINQGGLRFTEESDARGITGTGYTYVALGFDADHDGDTDLFEGNDFGPNVLWRNDGGQFTADEEAGLGGVSAYTMGAALADLEADGTWDLYVSNMSSEEGMRMVPHATDLSPTMRARVDTIARGNMLYRQRVLTEEGRRASWTEHAEALGIHEGEWAWGCQFVDVDGDGAEEILVTNGFASHQDESLGDWQTYYWRQVIDDGAKLESGEQSEDVNRSLRFQGSFNGHERDRLFVRTAGEDPDRPWVDGGYCLGFDEAHDGRAVVPIDADGDGDLDLALLTLEGLRYFENQSEEARWLRLRLLERGGEPALGARVYLSHGEGHLARHVGLVEGFQSQVSTDVSFLLGDADVSSVEVEVHWSDGAVEPPRAVAVGALSTLQRGDGQVRTVSLPSWPEPALEVNAHWRAKAQAKLAEAASSKEAAPVVITLAGQPSGIVTAVFDSDGSPLRWFRGEPAEASIEPFLALGESEPRLPHLLIQEGRIALDEARYRDALGIFRAAVDGREDLTAADAPAFEGLARAQVLLGRIDLAEPFYRRSVVLDPDYAVGHFNLAATYAHLGRFSEAIEALHEVERIEGRTPRVLGSMIENAGSAGDVKLARSYGEQWMREHPEDGAMLTLLGKIEARSGAYAAAKARFEAALRLNPRNREAAEALALTERLLQRADPGVPR